MHGHESDKKKKKTSKKSMGKLSLKLTEFSHRRQIHSEVFLMLSIDTIIPHLVIVVMGK